MAAIHYLKIAIAVLEKSKQRQRHVDTMNKLVF